jgi:hypothetical protein
MGGGGGLCPDNAAPGNAVGARCGGGGGEEAGEQQIRAPGDPCFSSPRLLFAVYPGGGSIKIPF